MKICKISSPDQLIHVYTDCCNNVQGNFILHLVENIGIVSMFQFLQFIHSVYVFVEHFVHMRRMNPHSCATFIKTENEVR